MVENRVAGGQQWWQTEPAIDDRQWADIGWAIVKRRWWCWLRQYLYPCIAFYFLSDERTIAAAVAASIWAAMAVRYDLAIRDAHREISDHQTRVLFAKAFQALDSEAERRVVCTARELVPLPYWPARWRKAAMREAAGSS